MINLKKELLRIFGDNLLFAFIGGSYLQNKFSTTSDIDIFCCVTSYTREQERKFRDMYFSYHRKMKARPDIYYPGELMRLKDLESSLRLAIYQKPVIRIKKKKVYDGLVWAGMLVSKKGMILGQIPEKTMSLAFYCIKKWNKKLFDEESISTEQLSEKIIYEDDIFVKAEVLLDKIKKNKNLIIDTLLKVESYETVEDELFRSVDCLKNLKIENDYLNSSRVKYISAFFPVNLPLYSLIIFGFIPSLMAKRIFVRQPEVTAPIVKKLKHILFENENRIYISQDNREAFIKNYVEHSQVILFTGRYSNVHKIEREFPHKLILYNGAGINPVVVNKNADINLATTKVLKARTFNSGQDCAGPDAILVHEEVYDRFINSLIKKIKKVKVGNYLDKEVRIGRLLKP
ncbi:MAG: aldehyde dehydrogenase family protein, partial [Candidatus Aenigmatarchaeota archaeon]